MFVCELFNVYWKPNRAMSADLSCSFFCLFVFFFCVCFGLHFLLCHLSDATFSVCFWSFSFVLLLLSVLISRLLGVNCNVKWGFHSVYPKRVFFSLSNAQSAGFKECILKQRWCSSLRNPLWSSQKTDLGWRISYFLQHTVVSWLIFVQSIAVWSFSDSKEPR